MIEGKPFAAASFHTKLNSLDVTIVGYLKSGYFEIYKEEGSDN